MQSAAAIGSRWMSHLQLAQLGSKQWSCPRTVLPISVGIGTIRAVRHLVPRDIVLDAAVRDGEAQTLQSLSDRSGSSEQGLSCARSLGLARGWRPRGVGGAGQSEHGPCPPRAPPSDDRQRPSATIGNGHRQLSATAIGNDRQRPSAARIGSGHRHRSRSFHGPSQRVRGRSLAGASAGGQMPGDRAPLLHAHDPHKLKRVSPSTELEPRRSGAPL